MPHTAYIVGGVRTAGEAQRSASGWHPIALGAAVLDALVERTGIDGGAIDDVIVGCVSQSGAQANIGRNMVLASKNIPEHVPGTSVDRQCGSSQQAIHFAAQAVMSGVQDVVIAAGVEHMSSVPIGSNVADAFKAGHGLPYEATLAEKYGKRLEKRGQRMFSQFEGAEIMAEKYGVNKEEMDAFAVASHKKAVEASDKGYFRKEIVPLKGLSKDGKEIVHDRDEGIRPSTSMEKLSKLPLSKKCSQRENVAA